MSKTKPTDFAQWCDANPPPDIHDLVRTWGNYWAIPEDDWRKYVAAMKHWQERRRDAYWR